MKTSKLFAANAAHSSLQKRPRIADFFDGIGALFAFGCSVHCALLPVAIAMIPAFALALSSFHDPHHGIAIGMLLLLRWEPYLLAGSVLLACVMSLLRQYREHAHPAWIRVLCASVLFVLALVIRSWPSPWWHAGLMLLGGAELSSVHISNLRRKSSASS